MNEEKDGTGKPWNDNVDIIMPPPDYHEFCASYHSFLLQSHAIVPIERMKIKSLFHVCKFVIN